MPSENQHGSKKKYKSQAARHIDQWDDEDLLKLYPMTEELARIYLGAANEANASLRVREHFVSCIERLK